jgi:hypothetical protein
MSLLYWSLPIVWDSFHTQDPSEDRIGQTSKCCVHQIQIPWAMNSVQCNIGIMLHVNGIWHCSFCSMMPVLLCLVEYVLVWFHPTCMTDIQFVNWFTEIISFIFQYVLCYCEEPCLYECCLISLSFIILPPSLLY